MTLRRVFAANLATLLARAAEIGKPELGTPFGLETETGVSDTAIARYKKGERAIDIDQLERMAMAYGLQPWELLHPDLDPAASPATLHDLAMSELTKRHEADAALLAQLGGIHGPNARGSESSSQGDATHHRQVHNAGAKHPKSSRT